MKNRVVITGIGVISSVGIGIVEFTKSLINGKSGVSRIESFDTEGFPSYYGAEVNYPNLESFVEVNDYRNLARTSMLAIGAARLALKDADLSNLDLYNNQCGVCTGTTDGEIQTLEKIVQNYYEPMDTDFNNNLFDNSNPHEISLSVSRELGLIGESLTVTTACAAGNYAVGYGYDLIKSGKSNIMLCGGSESISKKTFAGFSRLGSIAPLACQPFDKSRKGLILGEGSCYLVLENLESAVTRGAEIYAEILGYGLSCDAHHMTASSAEGIAEAVVQAHTNSGIQSKDIDYISAHGTGTRHNDITEVVAMKQIFGKVLPPISSIKSMIGHTLGAASALSLAACSTAIKNQFIPPTINFFEKDPKIDIDCVPNFSRKSKLNIVQNNAFAFGGNNAIVILGSYKNVSK